MLLSALLSCAHMQDATLAAQCDVSHPAGRAKWICVLAAMIQACKVLLAAAPELSHNVHRLVDGFLHDKTYVVAKMRMDNGTCVVEKSVRDFCAHTNGIPTGALLLQTCAVSVLEPLVFLRLGHRLSGHAERLMHMFLSRTC